MRKTIKFSILIIASIAFIDLIFFSLFIKPDAHRYYRDTGKERYIEAIAEFNIRSKEINFILFGDDVVFTLPLPERIPEAEARYQSALDALQNNPLPDRTLAFDQRASAVIDCFGLFYCAQSWVTISKDGSGRLRVLGLRPLLHPSRIFAPRARNLGSGCIDFRRAA